MDMFSMMRDLPKMMGKMKDMQAKLEGVRVKGNAGGGMVKVIMNGQYEMLDIAIDQDVVDPEDIEMLQDLVVAACADAKKNVAAKVQEELSEVTGGMDLSSLGINLPGMG